MEVQQSCGADVGTQDRAITNKSQVFGPEKTDSGLVGFERSSIEFLNTVLVTEDRAV